MIKCGIHAKIERHFVNRLDLYSNIYSTICNVTQFILSGNYSTCFGWYHHPSSGAHKTVSTASGICHTVTGICRCRGRLGTAFQHFHDSGR